MDDDFPLSPDTGWGAEVQELMEATNYDFDEAFARVMARFLNEGDIRPLLDSLRHQNEPGKTAMKYLAAMMVPERRARLPLTKIQYRFQFAQNRPVGRPRQDDDQTRFAQAAGVILCAGIDAMAKGDKPDSSFWKCFRYALAPGEFYNADKREFPWIVEAVRIYAGKGRRKNPELNMQRKALARLVQVRIDKGDGYDSAIEGTLEEINRLAKSEDWSGKIGRDTVKEAYAAHKNRGHGS